MFHSSPQPMWDLTIHSPLGLNVLADTHLFLRSMWDSPIHSPLGLNVLADTRLFLQSMWDPPIHSPLGLNVLADTRLFLQSIWDPPIHPLASLLTQAHVYLPLELSLFVGISSSSDTIYNSPSLPLAVIVLFGLFLKVFKMCLGEVFKPL